MPTDSQTPSHVDVADAPRRPAFLRFFTEFHNRTVLFRVGNWVFTTYAFLAGTAFAFGFGGSLWYGAMTGQDVALIAKLYLFLVVPAVLVGLRSFSILLEWRELFRRPLQTVIKPGYMLHGGIAGGLVGLYAVSHFSGVPFLRVLDAPALAMPLGEAIARLGCYVYGCCWGRPTNSMFGVRYTSRESKVVRCAPHLYNVKIHPAQLYALVVYLAMFAVFYAILPLMPFDGALAGLYLVFHSLIRMSLEYFRQDDRGRLWGPFTHTNLYAALMILGGFAILAAGFVTGGTHPAKLDMTIRLVHVMTSDAVGPWILMYALVFGFAYGVHYKKVGSWISTPSGGMQPSVDEFSMGAVSRMEDAARQRKEDEEG